LIYLILALSNNKEPTVKIDRVVTRLLFFVLPLSLFCGCGHNESSATNTVSRNTNQPQWSETQQKAYQREKEEALAEAERLRNQNLQKPPQHEVPLPNYDTGPGRPLPLGINFYEKRDYYPGYLLCTYNINESHYDPSNESEWFRAALLQIRAKESFNFPPTKWVAVVIRNRAQYKDTNTFAQCYRVGAIFDAKSVFDHEVNLRALITGPVVDRQPLNFDSTRPTPREQQRWLIVEKHMRANQPTAVVP
jgi:hypothetical protein